MNKWSLGRESQPLITCTKVNVVLEQGGRKTCLAFLD